MGASCFKTLLNIFEFVYRIAKRMNEKGDYFPILGICLGFELLTYVAAERFEHRINCDCSNQSLPLEFDPGLSVEHLLFNTSFL